MTVYTLHIFNGIGACLYEKEWKKSKKSSLPKGQELKLMFGMIHSINSFVTKMSPTDPKDGFTSYTTSAYKLHFYETPTGLKFVLLTDISVGSMRDTMRKMYSKVYVEYIARNPLIGLDEHIDSCLFENKLEAFMSELSCFADQHVKHSS